MLSEYTTFNYSSTDTLFWSSDAYQTLKTVTSGYLLAYDMMGTSVGYSLWEDMVSKRKRNPRELLLFSGIDSIVEIKSYYDTSYHVMERLVFDQSERLLKVELFLPEHKPVKQLQFSAVEGKKGIPVNSDKDLFYSRYEYVYPATGSVLRNIYHVSTYDRKGDFCKKTIKLSLVDRVPKKEVQIPNVIIPLSGMQALQLIRKGYRGQDLSE